MAKLVKPLSKENVLPLQKEPVKQIFTGFNVQTNRITSRDETYLKIKGAFKIRVQNVGNVDVTVFGNFPLPSYSDETFETGDSSLGFANDIAIQYALESAGENINILLTNYFRTNE